MQPVNRVLPEPVRPGFVDCYAARFEGHGPEGSEAYARVLRPSFDFEIPPEQGEAPFEATAEVCFLPDIVVSRARSTASRLRRSAATIAERGTDQILVFCYTSGSFEMTAAGRTRRVAAGELAFVDLASEVVIEAEAVDNVGLAIARPRLQARVPFLQHVHGFVRPEDALGRLVRSMIETTLANAGTMTLVDARGVSEAMLQLVGACLEPLARPFAEVSGNTSSLLAIKAYVEEHLLDPGLGQQALLDAFGLTRSTLYRLFEPLGGVTGYIARRRLHHAFRRLTDTGAPNEPVSKLAAEFGFSHPSAFTRAFKEAFGLSPSQVQRLKTQIRDQEVPLLTSAEPLQYFRPRQDEPA